jgi:holo-[acyl-carrier protein] synthase
MMIAGIGTDIIEIARIKRAIERNSGFCDKIFTDGEITYCETKADPGISYAARFAVKEAFMKALGTGWNHEVAFKDIETVSQEDGAPRLVIHGNTKIAFDKRGIDTMHVTISHEKEYAVATVVLERN